MPPLPSVPNVIKITHQFTVGVDLHALVRWHMTYTGTTPTDSVLSTMAATVAGHFIADCEGAYHSSVVLTELNLLDLSSPTGATGTWTGSGPGTLSGNPLSAGAAALVSMPIARRYRGGKPRSYWPFGDSEQLLNANTWTSGFQATSDGSLETYLGHLEGLTTSGTSLATLVSISYYQGFTSVLNPVTGRTRDVPKVRTGTIPVDPIQALHTSVIVASQRRRNARRR